MDLRDPHLEKALQHAPDRGAQPADDVRQRVLAYASAKAKPARTGWWARLREWHMTGAQVAGMGSIAVALLVVLMTHEQRPKESEWASPVSTELAAKADAPRKRAKVAESASIAMPAEEAVRKEEAVTDKVQSAPGTPAEQTEGQSAEAGNLQKESPATADAAPMVAPLPESPAPTVTQGEVGDVVAAAPAALPEQRAKSKIVPLAKDHATEIVGESEGSDLQYELMTQGGKALAERDIQAGKLRILSIESPNGERCDETNTHVPQVDAETGYPIEVVDVCIVPVELVDGVEAYNQGMRAHKPH